VRGVRQVTIFASLVLLAITPSIRLTADPAVAAISPKAPPATAEQDNRLTGLDYVLDVYVRDGRVYYRALKSDRGRLDTHVRGLATASVASAPRNEQVAFWLNAYNTIVLKTVIDRYPIPQRSREYPAGSIRQIPGAFEKTTHQVAGRALTLDQIEQTILAGFEDPRLFFAIGRGSVGGGRLRSEAYTAENLDRQLSEVGAECLARAQCVFVDRSADRLLISPIFSWREKAFVDAYAERADPLFATRSPLERAVMAYVGPRLLQVERDFIGRNDFKVEFAPFDWSLNDLTAKTGG